MVFYSIMARRSKETGDGFFGVGFGFGLITGGFGFGGGFFCAEAITEDPTTKTLANNMCFIYFFIIFDTPLRVSCFSAQGKLIFQIQ